MQPQINTAADDAVGKEVKTAMCRHLKSKERNEKILQWGALLNVVRCILDTEQMSLVHVCKSTFSLLQYVHTAGKSSLNLALFFTLMWPYIWCYWSEQCKWFYFLNFVWSFFKLDLSHFDMWSYFRCNLSVTLHPFFFTSLKARGVASGGRPVKIRWCCSRKQASCWWSWLKAVGKKTKLYSLCHHCIAIICTTT